MLVISEGDLFLEKKHVTFRLLLASSCDDVAVAAFGLGIFDLGKHSLHLSSITAVFLLTRACFRVSLVLNTSRSRNMFFDGYPCTSARTCKDHSD